MQEAGIISEEHNEASEKNSEIESEDIEFKNDKNNNSHSSLLVQVNPSAIDLGLQSEQKIEEKNFTQSCNLTRARSLILKTLEKSHKCKHGYADGSKNITKAFNLLSPHNENSNN